jgi:hypothetical protein
MAWRSEYCCVPSPKRFEPSPAMLRQLSYDPRYGVYGHSLTIYDSWGWCGPERSAFRIRRRPPPPDWGKQKAAATKSMAFTSRCLSDVPIWITSYLPTIRTRTREVRRSAGGLCAAKHRARVTVTADRHDLAIKS